MVSLMHVNSETETNQMTLTKSQHTPKIVCQICIMSIIYNPFGVHSMVKHYCAKPSAH